MSFAKFEVIETGQVFYYNNDRNALVNAEGQPLSASPVESEDWYAEQAAQNGIVTKTNKPKGLRLLLGHACNYSCGYCMQKDIGDPSERPENFWTPGFLESVEKYLDISELTRIELWGGEPFLYWNDMVKIMTHFDSETISWYISTNGSALRQKHVDFFKQLKSTVAMGISHDGPGQESLRGEDIFKRPQIVDVLKQLDALYPKFQYSFNPVVSHTNFDMFLINDYFYKLATDNGLKNSKISYTLGKTYDETDSKNSSDHVIQGDNLKAFRTVMKNYMDASILQLKEKGRSKTLPILQSNVFDGDTGALKFAQSVKHEIPVTITTNCGADASDILSMDLRGNVRLCPHTHEKYNSGHVSNIKGVKIISLALDRKKTHCSDCQVRRLCKSSCPIDFPTEVFLKNCRVEKIWYGAIQNAAFKVLFGSDVELKETGIIST